MCTIWFEYPLSTKETMSTIPGWGLVMKMGGGGGAQLLKTVPPFATATITMYNMDGLFLCSFLC